MDDNGSGGMRGKNVYKKKIKLVLVFSSDS